MKRLFAPLLLLISSIAQGQTNAEEVYDTAIRKDPYSTSHELLLRNHKFPSKTDSSMLFFQQYDQTKKDHVFIQNLGELSTPFIDLQFKPMETMGITAGMTPFMNLYFKPDSARFYNASVPFTMFQYAQGKGGQRGMIDFDAMHTQNFGRQFNISAKYHSASNDGYYNRQSLSCKNIQLSSYFRTKNNRYTVTAISTWNKINMMENGGIEQSADNDTLFKFLSPSVRIVDVSLNQARNINRYREHRISQVFWLLSEPGVDSISGPSGTLGIGHTFSASKQSNYYTDQSSDFGFYDSVYLYNSEFSADSFALRQYSNSLEIFTPIREQGLSFKAGIRYDNFTAFQSAAEGNFYRYTSHNTSVYSQFHFNLSRRFKSEAYGIYYLEGYNQNDYLLKWNNRASLGSKKQWLIQAGLLSTMQQPAFRYSRNLSNHYRWENNFKPSSTQTLSFSIGKMIKRPSVYNAFYYTLPAKAIELQFNYSLIDGWMYYGSDNRPAQGPPDQFILQTVFKAHLNLRSIQLRQEMVWQLIQAQRNTYIQLPELISKTSVYYQTFAFKKASFLQIGFDANITSSYQAGFYNPAIVNFRISNKSVGAYPYIDFFVNAEIKTARIFFKVEHLNQDLFLENLSSNYMFVSPYQPSAPRRFRLGFAWKFYY